MHVPVAKVKSVRLHESGACLACSGGV